MDYNRIVVRFRLFWAKIPHQLQAAVVVFSAAAFSTLTKYYTDPGTFCWAWPCLKHYLIMAGSSGVGALKAFYMLPNGSGRAFLAAQAKVLQAKADAYHSVINGSSDTKFPAPCAATTIPAPRAIVPPGGIVRPVK